MGTSSVPAPTIFVILTIFCLLAPSLAQKQIKLQPRGDESKYTKAEEQALVKLRKAVRNDLYADYMQRDEYLISWLRTKKHNVNQAAGMLRAHLKWRKEENIDDMHTETYPQFDGSYPYDHKTRTRDGRPVVLFPYSSWDVRKAALSGNINLLVRYLVRNVFELPQLIAREEGQADGSNATMFVVLVDLGGYNLRQHACVRCLPVPLGYVQNYETHYPQGGAALLTINTPKIFDPMVQLTRPIMTEHFFNNLHLLGPSRDEWKPKLDKLIDPKQLPRRYGGTDSRKV